MPLRLVLPISQRDLPLLAANIDLIRALGGVARHHIMLCPTRSVIPHAHQAAERLKPWAQSVEVIDWNDENYHPQPLAGNNMFRHVVEQITRKWRQGDNTPFFFMEADATPLKAGWADYLERDYALSGCKFMGTRMKSRQITGKDAQGKPVWTDSEFIEGQPQNIPFMVGVAVYSADIHNFTQGCCNMMTGEAWDKALKFYWNRSLHVTPMIQHQWRTQNYCEVDGKIIGEDSKENLDQQYQEAGPLSEEAMIHHGCKDGSLARLIRSRLGDLPKPPPVVQQPEQPKVMSPPPRAIPTLSMAGDVKFDNAGWTILQNSMQASGAQQAPVEPLKAQLPPLQFEEPEKPVFATPEPTTPSQQAQPRLKRAAPKPKGKPGRPRKVAANA